VTEKVDKNRWESIAIRVALAGWVVSVVVHVGGIEWARRGFGATLTEIPPQETLPVDIISDAQFSQMTRGIKSGDQKTRTQKVDKVAEANQLDDAVGNVTEKKELITTSVSPQAPPQPPEKKPVEKKPDPPKPEKKPVEKKPDPPKPVVENKPKPKETPKEKPKPEKKVDPNDLIAEAIKREEARKPKPKPKPETRTAQAQQTQAPPPKPPERDFFARISSVLNDHRDPTRQAMTGQTLSNSGALGTAHGTATTLSQSEFDAMRARVRDLWHIPPGGEHIEEQRVTLVIRIGRDRRVIGTPQVIKSGRTALAKVAAEAAVRAVLAGQPYNMLRDETYEAWKEMEIDFDPETMFRS